MALKEIGKKAIEGLASADFTSAEWALKEIVFIAKSLNKKKEFKVYKKLAWNKTHTLDQALTIIIFFYITETAKALSKFKSS